MIYVIEAVGLGLVKIGKARDPQERLSVLKTGCPVPMKLVVAVEWPDKYERLIHEAFRKWRSIGEWFQASEEVTDLVNTMLCQHVPDERKWKYILDAVEEEQAINSGRACAWPPEGKPN